MGAALEKAKKQKTKTNITSLFYLFFFWSFVFLGPHLWHMEVPRLGVESELQLPAYTTATAMPDPNCVCDLHHSSGQCRILNPLSEARDGTRILTDTGRIRFHCAMTGTLVSAFLLRGKVSPSARELGVLS